MILAAKHWLKLDQEIIRELGRAMYAAMDEYTEEEAEREYQKS